MTTYADTAQYLYDELGRLIAVADSTGVTAIYNYDAVGNLTSIDRFTPPGSGIGIYLAAPSSGPATTQVTIQGYGFDPTPANNQVAFNGIAATVVSATTFTIVTTVPSGSTTGSVTVTNTNGQATSPQSFTVIGPPTITALDPNQLAQGRTVQATITGTNLINATAVTFTQAGLSAAIQPGVAAGTLPITLAVGATVPPGTYPFSVTTPAGVVQSGTVTLTVSQALPSFGLTRGHVSVAMPPPPVPTIGTLSGGAMTVVPPVSQTMPLPTAPSGTGLTVTPPVSETLPLPTTPSGTGLTIAPPVSETMPLPTTPSGMGMTAAPPVSESMP